MSRTVAVQGDGRARPVEFVQSLERGLAVLRAFSADQPAMTLSEVARTTRLTRATARRLLLTFEALGYMRSDGRYFELTPRVLDLGYAYVSSLKLPDISLGSRLPAATTSLGRALLAELPDDQLDAFLARTNVQPLTDHTLTGADELRAAIVEVRRLGYAVLDQELEVGHHRAARPPIGPDRAGAAGDGCGRLRRPAATPSGAGSSRR